MDIQKTGYAICHLRKRAGFTQGQLAELLCVSDKAVSKWERGLSCPDISLLPKIAILLDTDIESLLYGHHFQHKGQWRGILLLDHLCDIHPLTLVYDKPLVYFTLGNFLLLGIKEILVSGKRSGEIKAAMGDGRQWGIQLIYDMSMDDFVGNRNAAVFCDTTVLYGLDFTRFCQRAMAAREGSAVLTIYEGVRAQNGVYMDGSRRIVKEKDENTLQDTYDMIPFLFCKADNWPRVKGRGTFQEMADTLQESGQLYGELIGRGMLRFDLHGPDSVLELSNFVSLVWRQRGERIACLEEIAWRRGLIGRDELIDRGEKLIASGNLEYGKYVLSLGNIIRK